MTTRGALTSESLNLTKEADVFLMPAISGNVIFLKTLFVWVFCLYVYVLKQILIDLNNEPFPLSFSSVHLWRYSTVRSRISAFSNLGFCNRYSVKEGEKSSETFILEHAEADFSDTTHRITCVPQQEFSQLCDALIYPISSLFLHHWFENLHRQVKNIKLIYGCLATH